MARKGLTAKSSSLYMNGYENFVNTFTQNLFKSQNLGMNTQIPYMSW